MEVKRGQYITSTEKLSDETGLSVKAVRTALKKLRSTGEINVFGASKFSLVTIAKYDFWQGEDAHKGKQRASKGQAKGNKQEGKEEKEVDIPPYVGISLDGYRRRYTPEQLEVIDQFFDVLCHTRRSGKISDSVICGIYASWVTHPEQKVIYALHRYVHSPALHDKKENYVLGMIRNATAEEIGEYRKKAKNQAPQAYGGKYGGDKDGMSL